MTRSLRILQTWELPLLDGRDTAIAAARHAIRVARVSRIARGYGWRAVAADRLDIAARTRQAIGAGRLGAVVTQTATSYTIIPGVVCENTWTVTGRNQP